ncbi:uncharacterized protein LOC117320554, partial [Pecten maximus]|uniref:uncharacterized protein LOC117320554 n=1 Tax=Pecten maximus TaxID=6579 RepID=UPI0014581789
MLDIGGEVSVLITTNSYVFTETGRKKSIEKTRLRSLKKKPKEKCEVKKGITCCGISLSNDMDFLDHFHSSHMEKVQATPGTLARQSPASQSTTLPTTTQPTTTQPTRTPGTPTPPRPTLSTLGPPTSQDPSYIKPDPVIPSTLLCCGDVEQNPGPDYKCLHQMCAASSAHFKSLQELARHITTVHVFDIVCLWDGCVFGLSQADAREMETHMLKHVYM